MTPPHSAARMRRFMVLPAKSNLAAAVVLRRHLPAARLLDAVDIGIPRACDPAVGPWQELPVAISIRNGQASATDPASLVDAWRFYRVRIP